MRIWEVLRTCQILHITPSSRKQLQAKKSRFQDLGFSLCWITKEKAKENLWEFNLICKCGLLFWPVCAQHNHYESKCERKSGGIYLRFHYESKYEIESPEFHL